MEIKSYLNKVSDFLKKYKYAALVLVIGLILMAIPTTQMTQNVEPTTTEQSAVKITEEEKMSKILSQIKGAGSVQVMLTVSTGEEILYQTDDDESSADTTYAKNSDTVIITDTDRNQNGLIRQVNPPVYLGAVVVCQGADNPAVKLLIVDAVSKLTGLGANRISVLKMK